MSKYSVGDFVQVLKPYKEGGKVISKYEIVQITNLFTDFIEIKNLMEEVFELPDNFPLKKIKPGKLVASTELPLVELNAAEAKDTSSIIFIRCINKMQAVVSNAMVSDNPTYLAKLSVAAACLTMASNPNMTVNQSSRLVAMCVKLMSGIKE